MALFFGNNIGDRVDVTDNAGITNLAAGTLIAWVFPTGAFGGAAESRLYTKNEVNRAEWRDDIASMLCNISRATVNCRARATFANFTSYGLNKWVYFVWQWNTTTDLSNKLYMGDRSTAPTEPPSYVTQVAGSGTVTDDTGAPIIGNEATHALALTGHLAFFGLWNRNLSLGEIKDQQYHPHVTSGSQIFMHFYGTGTQPNYASLPISGTVTGATASAHVPLGPIFSLRDSDTFVIISAPAALTVSVSDTVTISETTVNVISTPGIQSFFVSDAATVSEIVSAHLLSVISVSDATTVSEVVTSLEFAFVSVTDTVTVTEAVTVPNLIVVSESVTLAIVFPNLLPSVSSIITVTEAVTKFITAYFLSVSDAITVTEIIAISEGNPAIDPFSVADLVSVTDVSTVLLPQLFETPSEVVSVTEGISIGIAGFGDYFLNVSDLVTINESKTEFITEQFLIAQDAVTITDVANEFNDPEFLNVSDIITATASLGNIRIPGSSFSSTGRSRSGRGNRRTLEGLLELDKI